MFEIQNDWPDMKSFVISIDQKDFTLKKTDSGYVSTDSSLYVETISQTAFSIQYGTSRCRFICPSRNLDIHGGESVNCIAVSEDGDEILSGDSSGKVFLSHKSDEPIPLFGHCPGLDVEDCEISNPLGLFITCGGDMQVICYSSKEYQYIGKLSGHLRSVTSIGSNNGMIYSGSLDGTIRKWDPTKFRTVSSSLVGKPVTDFCFGVNAIYVSTEDFVGAIDSRSEQLLFAFQNNESEIFNCIAQNNNDIVSGTEDGKIFVWDNRASDKPKIEWKWYDSSINSLKSYNNEFWVCTNEGISASLDLNRKCFTTILGTTKYEPVRNICFAGEKCWTSASNGIIKSFLLQ